MNDLFKTEKVYVVWPYDPKVRSQQDGIDKIVESIGWTSARYGSSIDVAKEIVRNAVSYDADSRADAIEEYEPTGRYRGSDIIDQERAEARAEALKGFGRRAVYEVKVRHVGSVDAKGRFREIKRKKEE